MRIEKILDDGKLQIAQKSERPVPVPRPNQRGFRQDV